MSEEPTCTKKPFTKRAAQEVVSLAQSGARGKRGREIRVYHCPICDAYHTTKSKGYCR